MKNPISVLATDYDGTIAHHGTVSPATRTALEQWIEAGHLLFLVTGRELTDLRNVCPFTGLFHCIVGENGAVIHRPKSGETRQLAETPPRAFVDRLRARNVTPLSVGQVIVASLETQFTPVQESIEELKLPLHISLNKGSLMVLPDGVNKAHGLETALKEHGLSLGQVAGVGDAENDRSFLQVCGVSAAVGNALPELKEQVDVVLQASHGDGVAELISHLIRNGGTRSVVGE